MELRPYGSSGELCTVLGLGGACLTNRSFSDGVATVKRALELGVRYFDTSPAYCRGASQVVMGMALEGCAEKHVLSTKLGYMASPAQFRSRDALFAQFWESRRCLRRDHVDVLNVHLAELASWWKDGASMNDIIGIEDDLDCANAAVMRVLREMKRDGLCRFIGLTADHADRLAGIMPRTEIDSSLVAYDYSLLSRAACETALSLARARGTAYVAAGIIGSVLGQVDRDWGSNANPREGQPLRGACERLRRLQRETGMSLVEMSIRYLLNDSSISVILVGASTPAEIEASVQAANKGPLPSDVHRAIESAGENRDG